MSKIAFLSNRESDDTDFRRTDDFRWEAIKQAVWQELSQEKWRGHIFLIPLYTKFDRFVLQCAEQLGNPVVLYLPTPDWGERALPTPQVQLILRMKQSKNVYVQVVGGTPSNRLNAMVQACDGVFALQTMPYLDVNSETLKGKRTKVLSPSKIVAQGTQLPHF